MSSLIKKIARIGIRRALLLTIEIGFVAWTTLLDHAQRTPCKESGPITPADVMPSYSDLGPNPHWVIVPFVLFVLLALDAIFGKPFPRAKYWGEWCHLTISWLIAICGFFFAAVHLCDMPYVEAILGIIATSSPLVFTVSRIIRD